MTPLRRADGAPSRFFVAEEFRCRCAGRHGTPCDGFADGPNFGIDPDLVSLLDAVRAAVGAPVHVNCGYRCPAHNAAVGGVPKSFHVLGQAADIACKVLSPAALADVAERFAPPGLGRYPGFVHVDVRRGWDHPARWSKGMA